MSSQRSRRSPVSLPRLRIAVGFASAAVVLGTLVLVVDWTAVLSVLSRADLAVVGFASVASLLAFVAWSESLRLLFQASGSDLSMRECLLSYGAATFVRLVVPVGQSLGPAVFVYLVGRYTDRSYSTDLAPTSIGEVTNYLLSALLAVAGGLVVFGTSAPARQVRIVQVGLAVVLLGSLLTGGICWRYRGSVRGWILGGAALVRATLGRLSGRARAALAPERVDTSVGQFYQTAADLADDRLLLARAIGVAAAGWILTALPLVLAADAVGASVSVPLGLLGFLPLPGALGGVEIALAVLLVQLSGLGLAGATAVVLLYRVCTYWLPLLVSGGAFTALWLAGSERSGRTGEQ
ncbi:MAG: YbhN family protein [Halapricum sp.]